MVVVFLLLELLLVVVVMPVPVAVMGVLMVMVVVATQGFPDSDVQFTLHAMSFKFRYLDMYVASFQVRNVPPHGALYKSAIARLFRECGRGKAIYFEDTRYNFCCTFRDLLSLLCSQ